jgi:RNA polymerase sigma factor for flagellar operon FliA
MPEQTEAEINKLILDHTRLVKMLYCRFIQKKSHYENIKDELLSCAFVGLTNAARKYKKEKQIKFSTFSRKFIVGEMIDFLRNNSFGTRHLAKKISIICKAEEESLRKFGEIDFDYISSRTNLNIEDIQLAKSCKLISMENISLQDSICSSSSMIYKSKNPEETCMENDSLEKFFALSEYLPPKHKEIFDMYCKQKMTMAAIAKKIGVTESRISQVYKQIELELIGMYAKKEKNSDLFPDKKSPEPQIKSNQEENCKIHISGKENDNDDYTVIVCKDCGKDYRIKKTSRQKSYCGPCLGKRAKGIKKQKRRSNKTKTVKEKQVKASASNKIIIDFSETNDIKILNILHKIAFHERRSINDQILYMLENCIYDYEHRKETNRNANS